MEFLLSPKCRNTCWCSHCNLNWRLSVYGGCSGVLPHLPLEAMHSFLQRVLMLSADGSQLGSFPGITLSWRELLKPIPPPWGGATHSQRLVVASVVKEERRGLAPWPPLGVALMVFPDCRFPHEVGWGLWKQLWPFVPCVVITVSMGIDPELLYPLD